MAVRGHDLVVLADHENVRHVLRLVHVGPVLAVGGIAAHFLAHHPVDVVDQVLPLIQPHHPRPVRAHVRPLWLIVDSPRGDSP